MRLALTWPGVVVLACTTACSSLIGLDEFHEGASSSAGVGGEGGVTGGIGGEGGALGGSSTGGNGAAGGAEPTWPTQIVCTASYIPWFLATFDNVNGSAIGPTNIPGTPLERSGAPISTASGQAETEGNATLQASQGGTFASTDLRIRFAANFGGAGSVQVRVNDPGGFEVELSSQGKLRVASQGIVVSEASFNELPPGQYFVETRVSDVVVEAAVSTGRFPTDPAATRLGSLIATAPEGLGSGLNTRMDLTPAQGKIALDYVSVERCGATVPARTVLLADDFDDGLNALDIPSGSSWSPGTVAAVGGRARAHGSSKMTAGSIGSLPPYHQIRFVSRFRGESAYANLTIGQYGYYWSAIPGQEYLLGSVLGTSGTAPNLPDQDHFVTISRGPNGLSLVVELGGFGGSRPFLKDLPPGAGNNPNTEWSAASDRAPGDYIELDDLEVSTYSF